MSQNTPAQRIFEELDNTSKIYSEFQKKSHLLCPPECGKCCENPDIFCNPYELLPLAYSLIERGLAEEILENLNNNPGNICLFYQNNRCLEYQYRPYICRSFAVTARHYKDRMEFSVCKILKELYPQEYAKLDHFHPDEVPYIEILRKKFETSDPHLSETQMPINQALKSILEKILLKNYYN